jgi:hypothetical protein
MSLLSGGMSPSRLALARSRDDPPGEEKSPRPVFPLPRGRHPGHESCSEDGRATLAPVDARGEMVTPVSAPIASARFAREGSATSRLTGICHGSITPIFTEVATSAKKVPPMPSAIAGTKLA